MFPSQFTRERLVAERAREFEDQAARSRLADSSRVTARGMGLRCRLTVVSCTALGLEDVGPDAGRLAGLVFAPLAKLERSCTSCRARTATCC